mgnify:CR=1 FL=1
MTPDDLKRAGVRVRKLQWDDASNAETPFGIYTIWEEEDWVWRVQRGSYADAEEVDGIFTDEDEAKAAAQQHYENAILSALEPIHE